MQVGGLVETSHDTEHGPDQYVLRTQILYVKYTENELAKADCSQAWPLSGNL
jgi:hypothetical protein